MAAANAAIQLLAQRTGAVAGLIVVDPLGRIGYAHNSARMPVAFRGGDHHEVVTAC
jgi:isoaspartyl peptidase/L-asparaginase-like protein (Ntn-hydrolase superfamily)